MLVNSLKLKSLRIGEGFTQNDMGKALKISEQSYRDKENGIKEFKNSETLNISLILNLSLTLVNEIFFANKIT